MAEYRCSFCGKGQDQVKKLIGGPKGVFICDGCAVAVPRYEALEERGEPRL